MSKLIGGNLDFIAIADLHLTVDTPRSRNAGYTKQLLNKFENILKLTKKKTSTNLLVVAGDFFDSPLPSLVPYSLTAKVIELIRKWDVTVFAVPGQHDLRYHSKGLQNTPLGILESSGVVTILTGEKITKFKGISFVGQGWNEKIKEKKADVLVTHRMVIKSKLWKDQTDYITANKLLAKYPNFTCIISGDNHLPHLVQKNNRIQLNCGSIPRKTKLQMNYEPCAWKILLEAKKAIKIKLKVLPSQEVFDLLKIEAIEKDEERKNIALEKIPLFIKALFDKDNAAPSFPVILRKIIEEAKPNKEVKQIINNTMENLK